jgi:peptide/nickel transport system substrate-binding protein
MLGSIKRMTFSSALLAGIAIPALLAASPAAAETLKVGIREYTGGKGNPFSGAVATPGIYTWSAVYEQLTQNGVGGVSQPLLATGWKNIDPTTWEFKLVAGKFANGEVINAAAVKASYDWLLKTDAGKALTTGKNIGPFIADVIVVDDQTVHIKTMRPNPVTPKIVQQVTIVPPKLWADVGVEGFTTKMVGSGPYTAEFNKETLIGTPNPNWRGTRGNIDRIEWYELSEGPARAQALLSGQIDIDVLLSRDSLSQVQAAGIKTLAKRSTRTLGLSLVTMRKPAADKPSEPVKGPLADVRVRQALNYAIDKQAIVDGIFGGNGAPASQSASSVINGFNPAIKPYEYNPAKAKQLLTEAGYPNGFPLEFRAIMTDSAISQTYQAAVQDLTRIGLKVDLISQPFPDWIKHYIGGDWPWDGFGFGHDLTAQTDASQTFMTLTSCYKNPPYYCNQDELELFKQAEQEFDEPKRIAMLQKLLEVQRNNAPIIYLVEFDELMAYSPKVQNFDYVSLWIPYEKLNKTR